MAKRMKSARGTRSGFWQVACAVFDFALKSLIWAGRTAWKALIVIYVFVKDRLEEERKHKKAQVALAQDGSARGAKNVPLREVRAYEGNLEEFERWLYSSKSTVGIILGSRGSGKSALGAALLENWAANGAKTHAIGFEEGSLPDWIGNAKTVDEVPNGSVLLVDESGIEFSSRESMSSANRLLSKLLLVCRHKDISLVFISQNSSNLEINSIRQADYLLMKKPSLLQKDFERNKIRDIYTEVDGAFRALSEERGLVYIYSDKFRGFASNSLPSFWNDRASRAYEKTKFSHG